MKKIILKSILLLISFIANAQTAYRSITGGNWNAITTWQVFSGGNWVAASSGQIPGANDTVYIQLGHVVSLTQNQSCYDFFINVGTGTGLNFSTFTLNIHGKIGAFSSALNVFPVTFTNSNPSSATWLNCTSGGKLKFVGNTRDLIQNGQWGANPPFWSVEFALNTNQTGTVNGNFKAGEIIVGSGNIIMTGDFRPDSGSTNSGDVYINSGATLELRGNTTRTATLSATYDSLVINGTLILSGQLASQNLSTVNLVCGNGGIIRKVNRNALITTVPNRTFAANSAIEYAAATSQVIGGEFPSTLNLPKLIINCDSNVFFNGTRIVADSLILLKGILNIPFTDSLRLGLTATANLRRVNGWINGYLNRFISASTTGNILFPVGTNQFYRPLNMNILTTSLNAGDISLAHIDSGIGGSNIPPFADGSYTVNRRSNSFWIGNVNNGFANFTINISAQLTGQSGIFAPSETRIIGSTDGGISFGTPGGTHVSGSGDTAYRNGFAVLAPLSFRLYFGGNNSTNPLPVNLIHFSAKIENEKTILYWSTAYEKNNLGFNIEMSYDRHNFVTVGFIQGNLNKNTISNYQYVFNSNKNAYYRLKQIDIDGNYTFSYDVFVDNNNTQNDNIIFPNPFTDKVSVVGSNPINSIEILDGLGKVLLYNTTNTIETTQLSKGLYFIKINHQNSSTLKPIIKN